MRCDASKAGMHCASVRCEMKVSLMVCCFCPPCPPCATHQSSGAIRARYTTHFVSHRSPPRPDFAGTASPLDRRITTGPGKLIPALFWTRPLCIPSIPISLCLFSSFCSLLRLLSWIAHVHARHRLATVGECRADAGLAEVLAVSQLALSRMSSAGRLRSAHTEAGTSPCGPVESHPALPRRRTDTTAMIALDRLAAGRPLLTRRQRRAEKLPTTARGALQCLGPNLNLNVGVICPVSTPDGARRHRAPI